MKFIVELIKTIGVRDIDVDGSSGRSGICVDGIARDLVHPFNVAFAGRDG